MCQRDFRDCPAFVFSETWLNHTHPDSSHEPPGVTLYRADRSEVITEENRGRGVTCLINDRWCKDVKILSTSCFPDLETLALNYTSRSIYRESTPVSPSQLCIHTLANVDNAIVELCSTVLGHDNVPPKCLTVVAGDFNQARLNEAPPSTNNRLLVRFVVIKPWTICIVR